jgi:hypothetical protein
VLALALLLALAYARRRGGHPEHVLLLVALVLLARCLFDPANHSYYHAPVLAALLAYEALRARIPALTLAAVAAMIVTTEVAQGRSDWLVFAVYVGWAVPLAAVLARELFGLAQGVPRRVALR